MNTTVEEFERVVDQFYNSTPGPTPTHLAVKYTFQDYLKWLEMKRLDSIEDAIRETNESIKRISSLMSKAKM